MIQQTGFKNCCIAAESNQFHRDGAVSASGVGKTPNVSSLQRHIQRLQAVIA